MKIKICGLSRIEDIKFINEFLPDYAGFIFAEKSRRKVNIDNAKKMKSILNENIKSIGVFVDESHEVIKEIADMNLIDLIQLHGNESNDYIIELKKEISLPVIKAYKADINLKNKIEKSCCDYVLIDSYSQEKFGGTGSVFDWGLIPDMNKKLFLAGGLNINNIEDAIKTVKPYCVDINSGVETNGIKDRKKIQDIILKIKGYKNE